ncbi:MAG: hypothetical protein ACRD0M_07255, partial [Acidimicrobiales bacterium]
MPAEVTAVLDRAYREERPKVLATLARQVGGDLGLAEDAVQDAFLAAAADWPRRGVIYDRPRAIRYIRRDLRRSLGVGLG